MDYLGLYSVRGASGTDMATSDVNSKSGIESVRQTRVATDARERQLAGRRQGEGKSERAFPGREKLPPYRKFLDTRHSVHQHEVQGKEDDRNKVETGTTSAVRWGGSLWGVDTDGKLEEWYRGT